MENGERSGAREGGAKREIRVDLAERMMFTVLMVIVSGTSNFHDAIALVLYDVLAFKPQQRASSAHRLATMYSVKAPRPSGDVGPARRVVERAVVHVDADVAS